MSHRQCGDDSTSTTRHKQFVAAIENQIHRVETSVQETYSENGKEPLRWVNLSEEERDDLAMFLSGSSLASHSFSSESSVKSSIAEVTGNCNGSECVIDIQESIKPRNAEKTAGTRRTWSSPDFSSLRIIVPGENEQEQEKLVTQIEATPKVKGTKSILWMQRLPDHNQVSSHNHL